MPKENQEQNPYVLTQEALTMPDGTKPEQRVWLEGLMVLQREGIDQGYRPQNPALDRKFIGVWRRDVWNYYRRTLSPRDRRATPHYTEGRKIDTSGSGQAMFGEIEYIKGNLGGGTPGNAFKIPKANR